jgi:hypothetical protein
MKKSSQGNLATTSQNTLPKMKSQPVGFKVMPTVFTSGDIFFNPDTGSVPFVQPTPPITPPKLVPPLPPVTLPAGSPVIPPPSSPPVDQPEELQAAQAVEMPEIETETDIDLGAGEGSPIPDSMDDASSPAESDITSQLPQPIPTSIPAFPQDLGGIALTFRRVKGIVELPLNVPGADFCGSLHVPVEPGHSVILIILAKNAKTGLGAIKIVDEGARFEGKQGENPAIFQTQVAAVTGIAAKLQGDIVKDGTWTEQIITFLSGRNLNILAPRASIEAVKGEGGAVAGYFQGEILVQFVVTVVMISEGPVTHFLGLPYPVLPGGGVDTYLLPANADLSDFVRYLAAKNAVGWQGQKTRLTRDKVTERRAVLGRALMWGGAAIVAYTFAAGLLGVFFQGLALPLATIAPAIVGATSVGTAQLWRNAKRSIEAMQETLIHSTSWRLVNFAHDQVDAALHRLQGTHIRQFLGEMRPDDIIYTAVQTGKNPSPEIANHLKVREEITTAASFVLNSRVGEDEGQLKGALIHAISESRQKRTTGAAKVVVAVARARLQALLITTGKSNPADLAPAIPLDDLFSAVLARAKFPVATTCSVPLLTLESNLRDNILVTQGQFVKGAHAASLLIENTACYWPVPVKEVPYTKGTKVLDAAAPAAEENLNGFDDDFG